MQTSYGNKSQTSTNEKGQKRETKAERNTGSKGLSKVGIAYTTLREALSDPWNSSKGFRPMMEFAR